MRSKLLTATLIVAAAAWFLWPGGDEREVHDGGETLLTNRIWIERIPQSPDDKLDVFLMVEGGDAHELGIFVNTSQFEGDWSSFAWSGLKARHFEVKMLQSGKRHRLRYQVSSENCRGFDYCMQVKGAPRGSKHYYSMEDWVTRDPAALSPHRLRQRVTRVAQSPR